MVDYALTDFKGGQNITDSYLLDALSQFCAFPLANSIEFFLDEDVAYGKPRDVVFKD